MTHLLDTNSCVDHLRRGLASTVTAKLAAALPGSVVICSVVVAELHYGAHRSVRKTETLGQVQAFCRRFQSLSFDDPAAEEYGRIRAKRTCTTPAQQRRQFAGGRMRSATLTRL